MGFSRAEETAERLTEFVKTTHLDLNFVFDVGHAHIGGGVEQEFEIMKERIRSTHVHDNDGTRDIHLFPLNSDGGTVDWKAKSSLDVAAALPMSPFR